jgi:hypothetical protein
MKKLRYLGKNGAMNEPVYEDPETHRKYMLPDDRFTNCFVDLDFVKNNLYSVCGEDSEPGFPVKCEDLEKILYNEDQLENSQKLSYCLLSRLKADCNYFLNTTRYPGHLWGGSVADHISKMKEIYNELRVKPEWITMEDINEYEKQMTV